MMQLARYMMAGAWLMACFSSTASAVEVTMHGVLKNETAYFISGKQRLDKVQNRIDLKPEIIFTDRWEFRGRVLAWYDAAMDLEATNNTDLTASIKDFYRTFAEIKEAYLLYGGDDFDLRLGQQQIVWGKTDGLRLLDIVNPLNMQEFLLDDFLDSRVGVIAARLNYYTYLGSKEHEFELLLIPDAKVTTFAPQGSRWAYATPTLPAGVSPILLQGKEPNWSPNNTEYGVAWRSNLGGWDVSLNWFYGWQDHPALDKRLVLGKIFITPTYKKMHTIGGSFSNAFGSIVLRGEMAVNINEQLTTTASSTESSTWNAALGLDYKQNNWRISPQFFIRHLEKRGITTLEDQDSGFISLILSSDYLNEKLKPEIIALMSWSDGSTMIRPKVSYEFNDQVTGRLGIDLFSGKSTAFFGQFNKNDRVYTELEYTF